MKESTRWWGWITLIAVLHMGEQLIFGLQELQMLKRVIGIYDNWFSNKDIATVALVTILVGLIYFAIFCILNGGRTQFIALVALNMTALGEVHHLIETALTHRYTPGTVTAIPYIWAGVRFLRALVKERRAEMATSGHLELAVSGA